MLCRHLEAVVKVQQGVQLELEELRPHNVTSVRKYNKPVVTWEGNQKDV